MTETQRDPRPTRQPDRARSKITMRSLGSFFALAFGVGWGLAALPILFPEQSEAVFGPVSGTNPLFILAVYSPGIAGVLLVWRHYGLTGLGRFFRRLTLWRMPAVLVAATDCRHTCR